ncbi:hypothetical protein [Paenibacillus algicola]|uniref:hypothetical protein n=1 Tax=Paenibacillus algicola TaxID=2565926 RepID=UPI0010FEB4BA|nr:hypothetical protein [Paenibacillus algicola]
MNYLFTDNKKKITIVSISIVFLIIVIIFAYNFLKKEDPSYTSYSCDQSSFPFNQSLPSDKHIKVLSATSWEESVSPFSLILSPITSMSKIASLVDESNKLVNLAKQKKSDSEINSFTISKNACYMSMDIGGLYQLDRLVTQSHSQSSKIEVYSWIKNYRDYLSRDFHTTNTVIILNNSTIHTQINSSTSNDKNDLFDLISGIKIKITVYNLDNNSSEVI